MKSNRIAIWVITTLMVLGGVVFSQNQADQLYEEGRQLLSQEHWSEATQKFDEAAKQGGARADASLYWKAYAQDKQGLQSETLATLQELMRAFPESRWIKDAKALELKARQGAGLPVQPEQEADEDLKLIAINSLMNTDSERAVPLLEKVLQGDQSDRLKKKALFVLAQSGSPKAREVIERVARDGSNPEMQKRAIQHLGVFGGPENRALLSDIYASSNDVEIKKRVLHSFMVAGERQRVLTAAESEQNPELRRVDVQLLGVMGAREDLWRMYQHETDANVKKRIINALFVAGDHERMGMLAKSEQSPELRMEAVEKLGLMGEQTTPQLKSLYAESSDAGVRRAVLKAFFLQGNAKALIEIARSEKDPELKKQAVKQLSLMGSKEATDFMLEILNQ
jgi:HEAT repeat protein